MGATASPKLMTAAEFLALPKDGVERWLIRGELREKRDTDMSLRSKAHGITEARITGILSNWLHRQPQPRGEVICGEPGFVIRESPITISAGVDVAVISAEQADLHTRDTLDGNPELPGFSCPVADFFR